MQLTKLHFLYLFIKISNCFVIHDQNNLIKKKAHHMNDEAFRNVDYEMIRKSKKILDMETEAKMLSGKVYNTGKNQAINHQDSPYDIALKTTVVSRDTGKHSKDNFEYNYNDLVQEYYLQSREESKSKNAYYIKENESEKNMLETFQKLLFLNQLTSNCTEEETKGFGIKALKCILQDYNYKRQSLKVTTAKLWRIIKIWTILYFVVALPVWFTGGWCCCCLCCKIFKPHKTINEARNYLLTNPPGIFKDKYGETHYLPSEKEKEKYAEFEHLLRTI